MSPVNNVGRTSLPADGEATLMWLRMVAALAPKSNTFAATSRRKASEKRARCDMRTAGGESGWPRTRHVPPCSVKTVTNTFPFSVTARDKPLAPQAPESDRPSDRLVGSGLLNGGSFLTHHHTLPRWRVTVPFVRGSHQGANPTPRGSFFFFPSPLRRGGAIGIEPVLEVDPPRESSACASTKAGIARRAERDRQKRRCRSEAKRACTCM